jgi:hypothetical protein
LSIPSECSIANPKTRQNRREPPSGSFFFLSPITDVNGV